MLSPKPRILLLCAACALTLSACGGGSDEQPSQPEQTPASSEAATPSSETQSSEPKASTSETKTTGSRTSASSSKQKEIDDAREKFSSLAPASLFDQFDSCAPNGVQDSVACSGDEVGQFQFFASDAKAASTTQLLTELRSSRVVEDTGNKVVGWSTLGSIAVITVVDNDKGVLLQHMVSSDDIDPAERIYQLGLAERPSTSAAPTTSEGEKA